LKASLLPSVKRTILSSTLLLVSFSLLAQTTKVKNLNRFDQRNFHFGIAIGTNSAGFALHRKPFNHSIDSLNNVVVNNQAGFNIGIVSSIKIYPYLSLRFIPTLVLAQRNIDFNFQNKNNEDYTTSRAIESTYFDFPLLLKYRSKRLNNFAAYFIAGGKFSIDLASNEKVNNLDIPESIIKLKKNTTSAEVGIGTDFFLPYFKFAIELKMSYTLQNTLIKDNTELSDPLEKILPKLFFINISFEG